MNPTTHKLLKHSCQIIKEFPLPIAYYSEDANESWHKLYRKNMLQHARQKSRETRILDVFHRATYMTDPKISLIYIEERLKNKKEHKITGRMIKYISKRYFYRLFYTNFHHFLKYLYFLLEKLQKYK